MDSKTEASSAKYLGRRWQACGDLCKIPRLRNRVAVDARRL
jgi:hypothetical protein